MKKIQILGGTNEENKILEESGAIKKTFNS